MSARARNYLSALSVVLGLIDQICRATVQVQPVRTQRLACARLPIYDRIVSAQDPAGIPL